MARAYDIDTKIPLACKNACGAVGWGLAMKWNTRAVIAAVTLATRTAVGAARRDACTVVAATQRRRRAVLGTTGPRARTTATVSLTLAAALLGTGGASAVGSSVGTVKPVHGLCSGASLQPTQANISRVATATLCLIERERQAHHLGLLRSNGSLERIAAGQAKEMVVGDYFGDNSLAGGTPWQRINASHYASGAHGLAAAQNIGWGTEQMATPAGMVKIWMLSAPHREIMLTSGYRDIGVGVAPAAPSSLTEGEPGATYTVEFAVRR